MSRDHRALSHVQTPSRTTLQNLHRSRHLDSPTVQRLLDELRVGFRQYLIRQCVVEGASAGQIVDRFLRTRVIGQTWIAGCADHPEAFVERLTVEFDRYVYNLAKTGDQQSGGDDPSHTVGNTQRDQSSVLRERWAAEVFAEAVERLSTECDSTGQVDLWAAFQRWLDNPDRRCVMESLAGGPPDTLAQAKTLFKHHLRQTLIQRLGSEGVIRAEIAIILERLELRGWSGDHSP